MDVERIKKQLTQEGYTHIFLWEDAPNTHHPYHTHHHDTAHVIIDGSIEVEKSDGQCTTYTEGDRFDVLAGVQHYAIAGENGCTYLIGTKE